MDESGERDRIGLKHIHLPGLPTCSRRLKIVSARLWRVKFVSGRFTTNPDDVAAVQNDRLGSVWEGTSLNQWSNTAKFRTSVLSIGICSGV